ncbi:hypothetical protein CH06BL_14150 [Chromobacterium haemolyticum]|nr:hypothetical protein CH06BL_14150 [Chromobacterium haemolyticum]
MMRFRFRTLLAAAFAAAFVCPVGAEVMRAEGVASLDNGVAAAREQALQDALKMVALRQGARVEASQGLDYGKSSESGSLTPLAPAQGAVKVTQEFQQGKLYHVLVEVDTGKPSGAARGKEPACAMPPGRSLRRKIVTTYFQVDRPAEASDMPELATGLPTELSRRLGANRMYSLLDANTVSVLPDSRVAEPAAGAEIARRIGQSEDAQFVVAGRVLATGATAKGLRKSLYESNNTSQQGTFYNGPFAGLFGGGVKYVPTERQFDAEVWVYDALTGALLARDRVSELAKGDVTPNPPRPFASAAFWQSDYGQAVNRALDQAVSRIGNVISCIPFSARIVKLVDARQVYINAGSLDGVAVGDKFLVYQRKSAQPVRDLISGRELGVLETLAGDVIISQVQPNFAVGAVQSQGKVSEGDYVRFMPRR